MKTEEEHMIKTITKFDDKLSLLDTAASLFPIQKIIFGILADKNRPMTPGQIASEYYSQLATNIIMNWGLCNAANRIVNLLNFENPSTSVVIDLKPIPDKPLDDLGLNFTPNDYSAKLKFVRKAANWLLGKNSRGIVLSQSAVAHNLLALPQIQNIKERINTSKFYATIDPFVLKEWKAERTNLIKEINQNPFTKFDEELLRLFNLSNYLLSLRLAETERPFTDPSFFRIQQVPRADLQTVDNSYNMYIHNLLNKIGLPRSVLNTSLMIQLVVVPFADKLDESVFAHHFTE